jgi:HK97 family phage major capsid protein
MKVALTTGETEFKVQEAADKRAMIFEDMKKLNDLSSKEGRAMTTEEKSKWDAMNKDVDALRGAIDQESDANKRTKMLEDLDAQMKAPLKGQHDVRQDTRAIDIHSKIPQEMRDAYVQFFRNGQLNDAEKRALLAGTDTQGGYLITPQILAKEIIHAANMVTLFKGMTSNFPVTTAASLGVPTLDTDVDDCDWTPEATIGNESTGQKFGKRELKPYPLAKFIKISNQLIRQVDIDVTAFINSRLGYKIAVAQEAAYMTGDGVNKPLGIFTANDMGIGTARDVPQDVAHIAGFTGNDIINMFYGIRPAYRPKAQWVMNPIIVKYVRKFKGAVNQDYLWQPGLRGDEPDTLLGKKIYTSEKAPAAVTDSAYTMVFGDFSYYYTVDCLAIVIQRLNELFAASNQTGFVIRYEGDGMPVLAEAFARLIIPAA